MNVAEGLRDPLPDWVEHAHLAKYYGIPPWEMSFAPIRWVIRTRLLVEAQHRANRIRRDAASGTE